MHSLLWLVAHFRKRQAGEDSVKSSPSSRLSESVPAAKRMRTDRLSSVKLETPPALAKPNPLIVLSLKEMHEITRLFTSSPPGCADWAAIAKQTCQDRLNAGEVEYAANEFLPHVHYRSSIGKVVMERAAKAPSEFQKHKQTMKRMKQGLPLLAQKYKELTGLAPPVEGEESSKKVTISNFVSQAPESLIKELRKRAEVAMDRFVKGEVPKYALRSGMPVTDPNLTATGRIRKKYETKAIRLAKQAAEHATGNLHAPLITAVPKSAAPPFFFSTAKHFEKQ